MRDRLFEFFRPSDAEFEKLWHKATVIPDANVLLTLLRYNKKTSDEVIKLLSSIKSRIWAPHQAAYEFLNNSNKVFLSMEKPYQRLESFYEDLRDNVSSEIDKIKSEYRYHPSLDFDKHKSDVLEILAHLRKNLEKVKHSHPKQVDSQRIIEEVAELFSGRTGEPYDGDAFAKCCEEAKRRFQEGIPPGFADSKKDDGGVGDYIIWRQIMDFSKSNNSDVIFITEDVKDDWWLRVNGKTIGPRPELRREFTQYTSCQFYMYNLAQWLELIRNKKGDVISSETVEEARAQQDREAKFVDLRLTRRVELQKRLYDLDMYHKDMTSRVDHLRRQYNESNHELSRYDGEASFDNSERDSKSLELRTWAERKQKDLREKISELYRSIRILDHDREILLAEIKSMHEGNSMRSTLDIEKM